MVIENISKELFKTSDKNMNDSLRDNFCNEILDKIYFLPKNVDKGLIEQKLNDEKYMNKILNTIEFFKNRDIKKMILDKLKCFENDISNTIVGGKIFLIVGLDTTTIYSIKLGNEDVTVMLLESADGQEDKLDILLAHEFTHFIRKQELKKNIFEDSIGERFITEGIGCNYSKEIVPCKNDADYCLVDEEKVEWVKNNIEKLEEHMTGKMDNQELMSDFFSMNADPNLIGIPIRTGYIYGYLKVKEYLEKHHLKVKDIINIDWREILN